MQHYPKHFRGNSELNVLVRKLTDCPTKRADKTTNSSFIVSDTWGTCFFRFVSEPSTRRQDRIQIEQYKLEGQKVRRTYTRIPEAIKENVFHVFANIKQGLFPVLEMPIGSRVIGFHEPTQSGEYNNFTFLIYSPTGETPFIEDTAQGAIQLRRWGQTRAFDFDVLFAESATGLKTFRNMFLNSDNFVITKHNHVTTPKAATFPIFEAIKQERFLPTRPRRRRERN